ncbi:CRAL-TRIO domain-containing protein [Entophlyctis helioformis]|nr:CRAL-TRIO domain-containing protein [Entophlyctis helioformis]
MHDEMPDRLLRRYLVARGWDPKAAVHQLMQSLAWRAEYGVRRILYAGERDMDQAELHRNQSYVIGTDSAGHLCLSVTPALHDPRIADKKKCRQLVVQRVETALVMASHMDKDAICMVYDMRGFGLAHMDFGLVNFITSTFQSHYPERLGKAYVVDAPWVFEGLWRVIRTWLDPVVESKIAFVHSSDMADAIAADQRGQRLGGSLPDFEYIEAPQSEIDALEAVRGSAACAEAWSAYRCALAGFVHETREWMVAGEGADRTSRLKACAGLQAAYRRLSPFVRAPSTYNRNGLLRESAYAGIVRPVSPPIFAALRSS